MELLFFEDSSDLLSFDSSRLSAEAFYIEIDGVHRHQFRFVRDVAARRLQSFHRRRVRSHLLQMQ